MRLPLRQGWISHLLSFGTIGKFGVSPHTSSGIHHKGAPLLGIMNTQPNIRKVMKSISREKDCTYEGNDRLVGVTAHQPQPMSSLSLKNNVDFSSVGTL